MGQQQLLLITLGIILVIIAIVVGMRLYSVNRIQANKDALILDCLHLAEFAQQYYKKPVDNGGGGRSFTGWKIPTTLRSTDDGTFLASVRSSEVVIKGTGTEKEFSGDDIIVQVTVNANSYSLSISNVNSNGDSDGGDDDDGGGDDDDDDD